MFPKYFVRYLSWLAFFLSAAQQLHAAVALPVVSEGSIRPVPPAAAFGPNDPHRPYIKRATLQPAEAAAEMRFEVALKMRNLPELQARVGRGETIPFAEMAAKYYPTRADYQAVAAWLTGEGFKIVRQDDNHLAVFATASVAALQKSLQIKFARVSLEGVDYTSAVTAPSIPAAISPLLVGINGLQPHIHPHKHLMKRPDSLTGTGAPYTPAQILHAYSASGLTVSGSGQSIAIVIDTLPLNSDLTNFWSTYGVVGTGTSNIIPIKVIPGGTYGPPSGEESLDTEWSSSIATGAKIRIYAATDLGPADLDMAYQAVLTDAQTHPEYGLHQMTMSYGVGEDYDSTGQAFTDSQYFASLAGAGVTIFASSGDGGNDPGTLAPDDPNYTSGPVQVEYPASDPDVTGVGGTSLTLTSGSNISTETAWAGSGGGVSIYFSRSKWQTGTGVPAGGARCVPDVATPADPNEGAYYVVNGSSGEVGGTSWSSPTWAGFCALINQARANAHLPPLGMLCPKIYPLIGTTNFHDITSGNNGYSAGTGYDLVTGIGSPNVQNLLATLTVQPTLVVPTLPGVTTLTPGQNATFTVGSTGTAAGYSYQWQRMPIGTSVWSNITASGTYTGPTTAALMVDGLIPAMSGDQFQCVITTGSGTITTAPPSMLVVDNQLVVTTLAGQVLNDAEGDGSGTNAAFSYPSGVAIDSSGNLYVADFLGDTIRKMTLSGTTWSVTTPYGQPFVTGTTNGSGTNALFDTPNAVAIDGSNNIYVADSGNSSIRKITPAGVVSTFAGQPTVTGTSNGIRAAAQFNNPQGIAVDSSGNVYVADSGNNTIRKITTSGSVSTIAGQAGIIGSINATGTAASFNNPTGLAVDSTGNIYVTDYYNYVIREITPARVVTTPYGQVNTPGALDGIGTGALFNSPIGIAIDGSNNLYIADGQVPLVVASPVPGNTVLRRINPAGVVSTIAGTPDTTGTANGTGPAAQFDSPQGLAVSASGVIYLCDTYNQTIRGGGLAPLITALQGTQTVTAGQPVTFSVGAAGSGALTYQWYFNGGIISGATSSSYTIASTVTGNAGNYTVSVTDPYGTSTSSNYTLGVSPGIPAMPAWALAALALLLLIAADLFLNIKEMKPMP